MDTARRRAVAPGFALFALFALLVGAAAQATPFTPLEWQQLVVHSHDPAFVGQSKNISWPRDQNRNFIDDEIERRFHSGDFVDVIVDFNHYVDAGQLKDLFGQFGRITYVVQLVSSLYLGHVAFDDLTKIAHRPEVAMVEWQQPSQPEMDTAARAVQARSSATYAGKAAQDLGLDGSGVTIAFTGTGISSPHNAVASSAMQQLAGKWVAGFDASNPADPGDGSTDPQDVYALINTAAGSAPGYHESFMAVAAEAVAAPQGNTCEPPTDGGGGADCAGIAPGAKYVNVAQCNIVAGAANCNFAAQALDWLAAYIANHPQAAIRVANLSWIDSTTCPNDDGSSSMAEAANYLAANGIVVVAAMSNIKDCAGQTRKVVAPGSASFAITVNATDDKGTVSRGDDTAWSATVQGPRCDYDGTCPSASTNPNVALGNLYALKPDLAAPGASSNAPGCSPFSSAFPDSEGLAYYSNPTWHTYCGGFGTSPATAIVSGAAALVLQKFPGMTPDSLKWLLIASADRSRNAASQAGPWGNWDNERGWGLLDVGDAITAATANATDLSFTNCTTGAPAGQPCNLANGAAPWDNEIDITTSVAPQQNVATVVTTLVKNNGTRDAHNVVVNFGAYVYGVGNPVFYHIGTQVVPVVAAGASVVVTQDWVPTDSSHQCIQVSIAFGYDSDYSNNVTQRNFAIAQSHFQVRVENHLFARARYQVLTHASRPGWSCVATPASFAMTPEECPMNVEVAFTAPPNAPPGAAARCEVAVYAEAAKRDRRLLGGVVMETYVGKPCDVHGEVVTPTGAPVAGAELRIESRATAGETPDSRQQPPGARNLGGVVRARTDAQGLFTVSLTPGIAHTFSVQKPGVGAGKLTLTPACGIGLPWLVLGNRGVEPSLAVPPVQAPVVPVETAAVPMQ